ncbi:hypothetical protein GCM10020358_35220 [Amorphoplanes nipponensis]|uniref:Small secreted protein n=1 Tax=Actinoplanes nipponensis TaxID=135950 RepID=A0A919JKA6_9ACTN|nr:hypothetical protein [Actinoplanes nipponensis]GIE50835.1 hypothetical protein Ani05nite_43690 [Actinoplanes nipponensis]
MRRLLCVTAVSGAFLLSGAGCSSDEPAGTASAPTSVTPGASAPAAGGSAGPAAAGPSAGSGDAALSGNSEAICQQAAKTGGDAAKNFAQDLKLLIDAQSAQDADQVAKAKAKTTRDVENYSYALTDMSKLAADPALKAALADMGRQVTALKGDVTKLDADRLTKLQETLDQACGKG